MSVEKKATIVSSSVAALLVIIKMSIGIMSGSIAVLASAIDSMLDFIVSLFNYYALNASQKAPDESFNFGKSKIEPLAAVIEGTVIFFSALFIFYEALSKIVHPREIQHMQESIWVMSISIILTLLLVLFLNSVAKKTRNMVIKADALHYKTDIFSNGAVLLALGLVSYTGEELIDPILGVGIAIFMIYSATPIIKEGILMLLDAALNEEDRKKIIKLLDSNTTITDYHYLTTREAGSHIFISVHLVYNISISLYDAHLASDKIESDIKELFDKEKKVHIIIHMDPYDDTEINEDEDSF